MRGTVLHARDVSKNETIPALEEFTFLKKKSIDVFVLILPLFLIVSTTSALTCNKKFRKGNRSATSTDVPTASQKYLQHFTFVIFYPWEEDRKGCFLSSPVKLLHKWTFSFMSLFFLFTLLYCFPGSYYFTCIATCLPFLKKGSWSYFLTVIINLYALQFLQLFHYHLTTYILLGEKQYVWRKVNTKYIQYHVWEGCRDGVVMDQVVVDQDGLFISKWHMREFWGNLRILGERREEGVYFRQRGHPVQKSSGIEWRELCFRNINLAAVWRLVWRGKAETSNEGIDFIIFLSLYLLRQESILYLVEFSIIQSANIY